MLTISDGALDELSFKDSYAVENWAQPHPDPPAALRKYMLADLWVTRDANWWPDYPTSARAIQDMYALNQGVSTDGVIAVDMKALELVVGALEPLVLKEKGEEITAANIQEKIYEFWAPPPVEGPLPTDWRDWSPEVQAWWGQRKDFMPMLTAAMFEKNARPVQHRSRQAGLCPEARIGREAHSPLLQRSRHAATPGREWMGRSYLALQRRLPDGRGQQHGL